MYHNIIRLCPTDTFDPELTLDVLYRPRDTDHSLLSRTISVDALSSALLPGPSPRA
jgi:hypothetical protein